MRCSVRSHAGIVGHLVEQIQYRQVDAVALVGPAVGAEALHLVARQLDHLGVGIHAQRRDGLGLGTGDALG